MQLSQILAPKSLSSNDPRPCKCQLTPIRPEQHQLQSFRLCRSRIYGYSGRVLALKSLQAVSRCPINCCVIRPSLAHRCPPTVPQDSFPNRGLRPPYISLQLLPQLNTSSSQPYISRHMALIAQERGSLQSSYFSSERPYLSNSFLLEMHAEGG